jgi:hypothetical protein
LDIVSNPQEKATGKSTGNMPMYKDRQTLGAKKSDDRIEYRKYSFELQEQDAMMGGKGKGPESGPTTSSPKQGTFGPVFKDREHFNSMHFF